LIRQLIVSRFPALAPAFSSKSQRKDGASVFACRINRSVLQFTRSHPNVRSGFFLRKKATEGFHANWRTAIRPRGSDRLPARGFGADPAAQIFLKGSGCN
jgi:hypothetical protein